jgi:hypothetical protein
VALSIALQKVIQRGSCDTPGRVYLSTAVLRKECFAVDPASSERSTSCEAMADVPQKPSRGNCCDGLLHRPNAHVWCSILACRFADYADFGQVTSPFPLFCAKFLALLTDCIRHNPAVFSDLAVNPGNGGDQCRKILCEQLDAFKATVGVPSADVCHIPVGGRLCRCDRARQIIVAGSFGAVVETNRTRSYSS